MGAQRWSPGFDGPTTILDGTPYQGSVCAECGEAMDRAKWPTHPCNVRATNDLRDGLASGRYSMGGWD